jgi:long-chain fatty acid transport protein
MFHRKVKAMLLAGAGAGVLLAASVSANAGGFAVREQSAWGEGTSYAGVAAGGDLSAMFWNPATMTQMPGLRSESVVSGILPYASNTVGAGSTLFGIAGGTGNTAEDALVPGSYYSWQFNRDMWLGLSVNSPYGLSVNFPIVWAGNAYAAGSTYLKTYNATPSFAYKLSDMISIGLGVQIQYAKADLSHCVGACGFGGALAELSGTDWAYGFTAGVTVTPTPTTTLGIGYRSGINQKIDGTATVSGFGSAPASTTLNLPDTVSVGLRQRFTSQWTGLATVEWTNWSRIGTSAVAAGALSSTIPFQYEDGWLFSVGAEYAWDPKLTLRGGVGYEKSPITDNVRIPLLPDNDRYWVSVGGTYKWSPKLSFDLAYSHLFVKDTPINVVPGNPSYNPGIPIAYIGTVDSHIDIISVAMKYRWDDPAPEPVKTGYFKAK